MREWRRVPPALLLGFAIEIVIGIVRVVYFSSRDAFSSDSWNVYEHAFTLVTSGLIASGLFELARRLPRTAAIGARIAAIAVLLELSWLLGWLVIGFYGGSNEYKVVRVLVPIMDWLPGITMIAMAIGVGLATRRLAWLIALPVAVAIAFPIPPLADAINGALQVHSTVGWALLRLGPYPLFAAACVGAAYVASAGADAPTRERGNVAFERAAQALWLRLIAALGLAGLTLLVMVAQAREAASLMRVVIVLAPAIDAFALILFARAALGLSRASLSRWFVLPAAGAALWAAGVLIVRAFYTATVLYGHWGSYGPADPDMGPIDRADVLPVATPLVATAAIVLVLVAITQLLRERARDELRENATVRTGMFVVLSLGALYIARHEAAALDGGSKARVLFALVGAAFASIYALVIAAKLCRQAATVVADDTALPGAKLLSGGPR